MTFKAHTYGSATPNEHGDDDVYEFLDGGVLAIHIAGKLSAFYAPHKWDQIIADSNHRPGQTGGEAEVGDTIG